MLCQIVINLQNEIVSNSNSITYYPQSLTEKLTQRLFSNQASDDSKQKFGIWDVEIVSNYTSQKINLLICYKSIQMPPKTLDKHIFEKVTILY